MNQEGSESDRLISSKKQVERIEELTRENVAKVLNRGENLDDLQRRTDELSYSARQFSVTARRVKQRMCWQNVKLWCILLFILLVILAVLIVTLVAAIHSNNSR